MAIARPQGRPFSAYPLERRVLVSYIDPSEYRARAIPLAAAFVHLPKRSVKSVKITAIVGFESLLF
jgi:hypothetical protein